MKRKLKSLRRHAMPLLGSVIVVAAIGTVLLVGSRASSPYANSEVENGTLSAASTGIVEIADTNASSGSYVRFGSVPDTGGGGGGGGSTGSSVRIGLNMRLWQDNDRAAANLLKPRLVRFEMSASNPSSGTAWVDFYRGLGAAVQPLIGFENPPSDAQMDAIATWVRGQAGKFQIIEWGNENYIRQHGQGKAYGDSAKKMADRLVGTGVQMIIQLDDNNGDGPEWVNQVLTAQPGILDHSAVAGATIHPYGRPEVGSARVNRVAGYIQANTGKAFTSFYATELGLASDNGRSLNDNYGWPVNLTYQQAADSLLSQVAAIQGTGKVKQIMLYQSTDQRDPGASSDREHYFGLVQANGSTSKGALTTAGASLLAQ